MIPSNDDIALRRWYNCTTVIIQKICCLFTVVVNRSIFSIFPEFLPGSFEIYSENIYWLHAFTVLYNVHMYMESTIRWSDFWEKNWHLPMVSSKFLIECTVHIYLYIWAGRSWRVSWAWVRRGCRSGSRTGGPSGGRGNHPGKREYTSDHHVSTKACLIFPDFTISVSGSSCIVFSCSASCTLPCVFFPFIIIPRSGWVAKNK